MEWEKGYLTIESDWEGVIGGVEALLNERSSLFLEKDSFLFEWKSLLVNLANI